MSGLKTKCFGLLISAFLISCNAPEADGANKKKPRKIIKEMPSAEVSILEKWELPAILTEVSGIAYLDKNLFACIQDEAGAIFIYNTATTKIEKQISFGAAGDYEGIAVVNSTAYIIRSDGKLFEVEDINKNTPEIKSFNTTLTAKHDVEGITYDNNNNRLLLAIKGSESNNQAYKGIYAFDLRTKKFLNEPVFKILLSDPMFESRETKKASNAIRPSEIAIDPNSQDIFILEASNPQLLILNTNGKVKTQYVLDSQKFAQPEGMTFSPQGELFISNEGKKGRGNILKVQIKNL